MSALVPVAEQTATARAIVRDLTEFWQRLASETSQSYRNQFDQQSRSRLLRRQRDVRELLQGRVLDMAQAEKLVNYRLDQWHIALIARFDSTPPDVARAYPFDQLASELARAVGAEGGHLVVPDDAGQCEIWLGHPTALSVDSARRLSLPVSLRLATGEAAHGIEGFRQSYEEAKAAERIGIQVGSDTQLVKYRDVEIVALLLADPNRARQFVQRVLGPLLRAGERSEELLETLDSYLSTNNSLARTAEELHMHRNTVSYRLQQIKKLLATELNDFTVRVAVEIARAAPRLLDDDAPPPRGSAPSTLVR